VLNADDIVAHQLEGVPERISVRELLRSRKAERFDLFRVPAPATRNDLLIGGDVMLGRSVGDQIKAGVDPFAGIRATLAAAKSRIVNLECVVSARGEPAPDRRLHLRAPSEAVAVLRDAGIDLVSLANNHASDFGPEALRDSIKRLRAAGVAVVADEDNASLVEFASDVALLAINDAGPGACDRPRLAQAIAHARARCRALIALVHWGTENTNRVTERQRDLARWLIDHDVDLVAGAHPHCIQPLDYYHGRPIIYSLGNFVFDGAPTVPGWNRGQLLEVGVDKSMLALRLVPVRLDKRGFPHAGVGDDLSQR
jgi:poly-gamma-glutamate synthesis protein (capsule biosynthesis protein)